MALNFTASLLRLAEEGLARPPLAATAAAAAAQLAAFTYLDAHLDKVSQACKWNAMGVTRLGNKNDPTATKKDIVHSPELLAVLALPCVAELLAEHKRQLWDPLLLKPGQQEQPRTPEAAAAARAAYNATEPGTWARFAKRLNLDGKKSVRYRLFLANQRLAWVQELQAEEARWGLALGEVAGGLSGEAAGVFAQAGQAPSARLVEKEDEELEGEEDGEAALAAEAEEEEGEGEDEDEGDDFDLEAAETAEDAREEASGAARPARASAPAAAGGATPRFRGKRWYPKLLRLFPRARPIRRSCNLSITTLSGLFLPAKQRYATVADFFKAGTLPTLRPGEQWGNMCMTNGYSVSVQYFLKKEEKEKKGAPKKHRRTLLHIGHEQGEPPLDWSYLANETFAPVDLGATSE
jgi:hypothetical protein